MDLSKLLGIFSAGEDDIKKMMNDTDMQEMMQSPQMQALMQNPNITNMLDKAAGFAAQGGIMPDDVERMTEEMGGIGGLMSQMGSLFGGMGCDEIDLDEEVEAYEPEAFDSSDRAFVTELKAWLKDALTDIPADDVCMLEIGFHVEFTDETLETPVYDLWLAYNTEKTRAENREKYGEDVWNWINWTDDHFRTLDDEPFAAWRESQGYDEENDGDEMIGRIYDLVALAVMDLHKEQFTEHRFGKKVPFVIEDYEYSPQTAIRAVKANGGKELFSPEFYAACGFEPDEET